MKRNNRMSVAMLCIALVFSLMLTVPVFSADKTIEQRPASLTISYVDGDTPIVGAVFDIYRIATVLPDGTPVIGEEWSDITFDLENRDKLSALCETLSIYVQLKEISPAATLATDSSGSLTFTGLSAGLYLVLGRQHFQGELEYVTAPFLVTLPGIGEDGESLEYNVKASPKFETIPGTGGDETDVSRKVIKIWKGDGEGENRPESITVHLLCDGRIHDTVLLTKENSWRYTWEKLDPDHTWAVAEEVPEGYTVTVTREGITYVITNTKEENTPPPPPDTPPPEDLPQTGQLWWPVPVLIVSGIVLFLMGCIRRKEDFNEG